MRSINKDHKGWFMSENKKTDHTGRFRYSLLKDVPFSFSSRSIGRLSDHI